MIKKKDLILISAVLLVALISFGAMKIMQKDGKKVVVTVDGKEMFHAELHKNQTYEVPLDSGKNVIKIKNGKVKMIQADCPDQICKNHKEIHKSGETIVCLPHKVVVEVQADADDNELDGVTK